MAHIEGYDVKDLFDTLSIHTNHYVNLKRVSDTKIILQCVHCDQSLHEVDISEDVIIDKRKTLKDCLPWEAMGCEYFGERFQDFADVKVIEEVDGCERRWPGTHKNVMNWYILANGKAVGWNENPARGWSFPFIPY